jgi:hypothetical protein
MSIQLITLDILPPILLSRRQTEKNRRAWRFFELFISAL